ncbi:MAG: hypothetical protein ABIS07_08145 [Dokdonella sp.]
MASSDDDREFRSTWVAARHASATLVLAILALACGSVAALAPGADGAQITIPISGISDIAQAVATDPNGNFVLAGSAGGNYSVLARRVPSGAPDDTFGINGIATHDLSPSLGDGLRALVRMDDGRYAGCGIFVSATTANDFVAARFNASGSLDTSFDGVGFAVTPFGPSGPGEQCNAVAVQADGMIVSAGYTYETGAPHVALTRHTASGQLDPLFGTGGKLVVNASGSANGASEAKALLIQPDGKLLIAGYAFSAGGNGDFLLMRLNADGSPDSGFGSAGITRTPIGASEDIANAMVRQPDGRIVLAGSVYATGGQRDFALARYTANGVLDPSFGNAGLVTTAIGPSDDYAYALALMPWGRLVAAGSARVTVGQSDTALAVAAYNTDGSLDHYFGDAGKRMISLSTANESAYGLASDIGGARFWAIGTATPGASQDFLAIEFGLPDTIFRYGQETL